MTGNNNQTQASDMWLALITLAALASNAGAQGLTTDELAAEAGTGDASAAIETLPPVAFKDAEDLVLTPAAQGGYSDPQGRLVVDVIEGDNTYVAIRVSTKAGAPVSGAKADTAISGTSRVVDTSEALLTTSDTYGFLDIAVLAGKMGRDVLTVRVGDADVEIVLNVLSLAAAGVPDLPQIERGIPWSDLMQANVQYVDGVVATKFPEGIAERDGQQVRIAGFMTPLQAGSRQRWFLLTSSPPHCYFDIPGGPAGTIEVLAPEGVDVTWEPVVIEGRFEPIAEGDGTVYRLHEARMVNP
ncbi:MAG: hypothetical protein AAGA84_11725 [Pseudomonadota bacterium]